MKRYYLLVFSFSLALLFFVYGTFADRESMKWSAVGLSLIVLGSMRLGDTASSFLSYKTRQIGSAMAASTAFTFLLLLLGAVFLWNIFVRPIQNFDFAVFGSLFLSILAMRIYAFQMLSYIGKPV